MCLGKTFTETTFRVVFPLLLNSFEFEFVNKEDAILENKKHNNAIAFKSASVMMKLKQPSHRL